MPPFVPKEQPLVVFFDLTLGNLSNIYKSGNYPPGLNIPVDFTLTHSNGMGEFSFTLFDVTGTFVEPHFWQAGGQASFQFGYQGKTQLKSDTWRIMTGTFKPRIMQNSFEYTFKGTSNLTMPAALHTVQHSGTFNEIMKDFQKAYPNLKITVTPDVARMVDVGYLDKDSTEPIERQWTKWLSETDWAFLTRIVKCARTADGKSGYRIMYNPGDSQGSGELLIYLPGIQIPGAESGLNYSYPSREGNVIDFDPTIEFNVFVGGGDGQIHNYNTPQGAPSKTNMSPDSTKDMNPAMGKQTIPSPGMANSPPNTNQGIQIMGNGDLNGTTLNPSTGILYYRNPETMPDPVTQGSLRTRPAATSSGGGKYVGMNDWYWGYMQSMLASTEVDMTIIGDPRRKPGEIVHVDVYYPKNYDPNSDGNKKYYLTGDYLINQVTHRISVSGGYQTVLNMQYLNDFQPPMQ